MLRCSENFKMGFMMNQPSSQNKKAGIVHFCKPTDVLSLYVLYVSTFVQYVFYDFVYMCTSSISHQEECRGWWWRDGEMVTKEETTSPDILQTFNEN